MCKVRTKHLLAINGLMWTAIGTKIAVTGLSHYFQLFSVPSDTLVSCPQSALLWMIPLSILVFAAFYMMFTGVVRKYSARIMAMTEEKTPVWKTFSLKGYLIIAFMISLGISLKHIPGVPFTFFAWFHTGLGLGLLSAGIRFLLRWLRER